MQCGGGSQQYIGDGFPFAEFVTLAFSGVATIVSRDLLVQFKKAYKLFWVTGIPYYFSGSDVAVHMYPLNLSPNAPANRITDAITGAERWILLANNMQAAAELSESKFFKFSRPVDHFYIDIDHPNGANTGTPNLITFGGTNDIDEMFIGPDRYSGYL